MVHLGVIAITERMVDAIGAKVVNRSGRGNQSGTAEIVGGTPRRVAQEIHNRGIEPALGNDISGKWRRRPRTVYLTRGRWIINRVANSVEREIARKLRRSRNGCKDRLI